MITKANIISINSILTIEYKLNPSTVKTNTTIIIVISVIAIIILSCFLISYKLLFNLIEFSCILLTLSYPLLNKSISLRPLSESKI